jgi:hypothetical protein
MLSHFRRHQHWLYLAGILWLNVYLVRQIFAIEFSAQPQSMHGFWMAIARLAEGHWWTPHWWPYWYGGMPFELTYAPLVPWLAKHLGLYRVIGLSLCLVPLAVYGFAWRLTGKAGWSFVAAIVYSVSAPTELLFPDGSFGWAHLGDARRIYLQMVWDETPHYLALGFLLLGWRWWSIALAALANPFGVTGAILFGLCWVLVSGEWKKVAVAGVLGYLVVCPFYPPSLLPLLRANAALFPGTAWSVTSTVGLTGTVIGMALLWAISRRLPIYGRFLLLLTCLLAAIPWLEVRWGSHFVLQPMRYKIELEAALVLCAVFTVGAQVDRTPGWCRVLLGLALLWPASEQVIRIRRFSKELVRSSDAGGMVEYRAARWMEQNIPQKLVFAPGSIAQWMNAFSNVKQYTGGSYPTAPTTMQQTLMWAVFPETEADRAIALLQQAGVEVFVVSGQNSSEFWKPYAKPEIYAGRLELLWEEQDTRIYAVPRQGIIPVEWRDDDHFFAAGPGVTPVNWHIGWRAFRADGSPSPITANAQGQIVVSEPVLLAYDGGLEAKLCRAVSLLTLLGCITWPLWRRRLPVDH